VRQPHLPAPWLWEFLKTELATYPGRGGAVARMVLAATLVMIICNTYRVPYAFQGAIYALLVSRESPRATLQSAGTVFGVTVVGVAYLLVSAWFIISVSGLHLLWNIASLFLAFYGLAIITNYSAASIFAIMISVGVPLWDRHVPAERNVEDTLWFTLAAGIGVLVTAAVELAFVRVRPGDHIVRPVAERLATIRTVFVSYAEAGSIDHAWEKKIIALAMVGTSRLRRALRRSDYSSQYCVQMSAVVALVGSLVDVTATVTQLKVGPSDTDRTRLRNLAAAVGSIGADLLDRRIPRPVQFSTSDWPAAGMPLLREMENTVTLIPQTFVVSRPINQYLAPSDEMSRSKVIAPDALANPEHLKFAIRGCLAASLCYIIYNSIAWPGISTAVPTCLLTALSTIGASRQKQLLRFGGALVGGFLISMHTCPN
jgi:multidrug resistance protein MdtO